MRWVMGDIETALKEKEYVDTAVIPLFRVSWGVNAIENAKGSDYTKEFCNVLEDMYRGRVILFPHLSYTNADEKHFVHQLNELEKQLQENGIQYIFYIVSDVQIKALESEVIGNIIWLPLIPLYSLDFYQQREILQTQVKSVMLNMEEKWKVEKAELTD